MEKNFLPSLDQAQLLTTPWPTSPRGCQSILTLSVLPFCIASMIFSPAEVVRLHSETQWRAVIVLGVDALVKRQGLQCNRWPRTSISARRILAVCFVLDSWCNFQSRLNFALVSLYSIVQNILICLLNWMSCQVVLTPAQQLLIELSIRESFGKPFNLYKSMGVAYSSPALFKCSSSIPKSYC